MAELLVGVVCGEALGLLAGLGRRYPGEPRLGSASLGCMTQLRWSWCVAERIGHPPPGYLR
jgi:hypothetical protein